MCYSKEKQRRAIADSVDKALTMVRSGYEASKTNMKPIWDRRNANFRRYIGPLPKDRPKTKEDFHVPYTSTLLNNVWPLLAGRIPVPDVDKTDEGAKKMKKLLTHTFDINAFDLTYLLMVKGCMLANDAFVQVGWEFADSKTDHATIKLMNTNDVIPHAQKIFLDDRWPIYIHQEMTKDEMLKKGWDKAAINSLGKSNLNDETYRAQQLQLLGYSKQQIDEMQKNRTDDLYEVVHFWGMADLKFGTVAQGKEEMAYIVMVNNEKIVNLDNISGKSQFQTPYKHTKIPISHLPYDQIPGMFLGQGFIDPIASQQDELDYLEWEKAQNYRRRNNPPLKIRRSGRIDLSTLKFMNSLPWIVNEQADIEPMIIEDIATSIGVQQDQIKRVMQNRTGANDVLLVSDATDIKGGDTALGASIANENTKLRFRPQASFIDKAVERIGDLCINMYQDPRLFDRAKEIADYDEEGQYNAITIRPAELRGEMKFKVNTAAGLARSENTQLMMAFKVKEFFMNDQTVNMEEIDKVIFEAAGFDYNKAKMNKQDSAGVLAQKLQQLVAVTKSPEFMNMDIAQRSSILIRIKNMSAMLKQQGGMEGGGAPVSAPTEAGVAGENPVPAVGGQPQ